MWQPPGLVLPVLLTVVTAALLGGAIAAGITAVIVIAAAGLVLIGLGNGVVNLARFCDDNDEPR